jgi:hypothetical protein
MKEEIIYIWKDESKWQYEPLCQKSACCNSMYEKSALCSRHYKIWRSRKDFFKNILNFLCRKTSNPIEITNNSPKSGYELGLYDKIT